jgi:hypothetical protein
MAVFQFIMIVISAAVCGFAGYAIGFRQGKAAPVFRRAIPTPADEELSGPQIHLADFRRANNDDFGRITGKKDPTERR